MLLELRHADGRYGQIQAVRDISLRVEVGGSVALLGRNGAGKTTVLRLISGTLPLAGGEILWDGEDISGLPAEDRVRRGIVLVPEGRGIFPGLTVEENLTLGAYWHRPKPAVLRERRDGVYDILPRLRDLRRRRGGSLSGGEQQMLAIGRALMSDPKVLLLDEPSLGLAPMIVDAVYQILRTIVTEGVGVVVVEQHVGLALELCEQVVGLDKGKIVISGQSNEVRSSQTLQTMYMASEVVGHAAKPSLPEAVTEHLRRMVDAVDETGIIALYSPHRQMMMLHTVIESSHPLDYVKLVRDRWVPVTLGASGLGILAFLPEEERHALLARRLEALTDQTITDPAALEQETERVRERGYAISHGQRVRGAVGIAAPVFAGGVVMGDVMLSIPEERFDPGSEAQLAEKLLDCARAVTAELSEVSTPAGSVRR